MKPRMHPLDRLIRRIQREPGSRKLDLQIARTLYGHDAVYMREDGTYMVVRNTRASVHRFELPAYTATEPQLRRAVYLLRKRKAELTAAAPAPVALRMAA